MEQALKTDGLCTPDVIKSALDHKSEGSKISETTIDSLFGVPDKIVIPERYIPDTVSIITFRGNTKTSLKLGYKLNPPS